jgi:hypothetical protein
MGSRNHTYENWNWTKRYVSHHMKWRWRPSPALTRSREIFSLLTDLCIVIGLSSEWKDFWRSFFVGISRSFQLATDWVCGERECKQTPFFFFQNERHTHCVCVCVCVRERERESKWTLTLLERVIGPPSSSSSSEMRDMHTVCVWERERECNNTRFFSVDDKAMHLKEKLVISVLFVI